MASVLEMVGKLELETGAASVMPDNRRPTVAKETTAIAVRKLESRGGDIVDQNQGAARLVAIRAARFARPTLRSRPSRRRRSG